MARTRFFVMLLFLLLPWRVLAEPQLPDTPEYSLQISFDVPQSRINGRAAFGVRAGREVLLQTGDLAILGVSQNSREVPYEMRHGSVRIVPPGDGPIEIRYEGTFRGGKADGGTNYGVVPSVIGPEGISLTGTWYPRMDSLNVYKLRATLPAGYSALSEAEEIERTAKGDTAEFTFVFPHPVDGISFVASDRYSVQKRDFNGIALYAYFFPEERELARTYLDYAKRYLTLYAERFGAYPYQRFAVVENFLPSGYSLPTFTLLGREVVRLPFIVETSLGHEIAHQWFGNSVYVDYEKGNWAEGLTTYVADHFYEERKGRGWEYRKQMLIDYGSYVDPARDFPLKDFMGREDLASKAIGYGKAAMVFHMLKKLVGEDVFSASLREFIRENLFQKASWEDIRKTFEKASGKDLAWFFTQWVTRAGIPEISFGSFTVNQGDGQSYGGSGGVEVGFSAGEQPDGYTLDVPVTFHYREGSPEKKPENMPEKMNVRLDKASMTGTLHPPALPERIVVDEDYDLMRKLAEGEMPAVIARLIGGEKLVVVPPLQGREIYSTLIEAFKERGATVREASSLRDTEVHSSSLALLGSDNPLAARLFGSLPRPAGGFTVLVKENPWNPQKVVGIFHGKSKEEVEAAFRKIFHYGKYSSLTFDRGRNVEKETEESRRGLKVWNREQTTGVEASAVRTLPEIIEGVSGKKIVYVGEYHDRFSHHAVQLEVIKGFFRLNRKLAIGMEMFQTPCQKVLDDYIAGKIDEKEFLKKSEYFKRWTFDYRLYKPILDFAR
ncbi:MAG: ChaN family lipoprotein, partial [Nitrospirales bacterium]|nr:ChaN family lipoprotein [Nitrospirales bacterium]